MTDAWITIATKLIKVGMELFAARGYNATGIGAVLKQAGVPRGSFYHHFDSKEEFGLAIIEAFTERFLARLDVFLSDEIRKSFHLFCDNFPFPVMLIHKDRTILAVNETAEEEGYPTGIRCSELGKKEHHKGCLANKALAEQTARRVVGYAEFNGAVLDSYWIPLAGSEDLYLHFAQDISEWAKESLFPEGVKTSPGCTGCSQS